MLFHSYSLLHKSIEFIISSINGTFIYVMVFFFLEIFYFFFKNYKYSLFCKSIQFIISSIDGTYI